jgi:CARDB
MPDGGGDLWIANTISDLIQGDVDEHLPLEAIPLRGDVLGLGTTTSVDNGELTFLRNEAGNTTIWKSQASALRVLVDPAGLGAVEGQPLQELVGEAIRRLRHQGRLAEAPIYGLRMELEWQSLVITVSSKLCMGQQRRNARVARSEAGEGTAGRSIYQLLQHYRLAPEDPGDPTDPIRYLGRSLTWDCCGFYDSDPLSGRVTVPQQGAHLHLHGCSLDLRHGGHLLHEHPETCLRQVRCFALYPLQTLHQLVSDLAVEQVRYSNGALEFRIANRGSLDVSHVGVAVVINDRYSDHRYLRLPWLAAGESEPFSVPMVLGGGRHRLEVIADPEQQILEAPEQQANNRAVLEVSL